MEIHSSTEFQSNEPFDSSFPIDQLELDIREFENSAIEGVIEWDSNFRITKSDIIAKKLTGLHSSSIDRNGEDTQSIKKIRYELEQLAADKAAQNRFVQIVINDKAYDVLMYRQGQLGFICRIRAHFDYKNESSQQNIESSPLLNTGILLWTMDAAEKSIKLRSPSSGFLPPSANRNSHDVSFWINRVHPEDQNKFKSQFEAFAHGYIGSFHFRYRFKTAHDQYEWVSTIARRPLPTPEQPHVQIHGVHINNAEIPSSCDELRVLSYIAKKSRIPISITNRDGISLWTNTSFQNMFGYDEHELRTTPLAVKLSGNLTNLSQIQQLVDNHKGNATFVSEILAHVNNEPPRWCKLIAKPLLDENGVAKCFITFVSDITEYKKSENAFLQNETKFRSLFENASDALLIVSLGTGQISESNSSAKSFFKCPDLFNLNIKDLTLKNGQISIEEINRNLIESSNYKTRTELLVDEKSKYTVDILVSRIDASVDNSALVTIRNITDELYIEEQLLHSQRMQAVGKLAGGVAHDFNNLLSGIRGFAELIGNANELSETSRIYLKELLKTSDRATKLTSRLLSFSRQRSDTPKVCDLNAIVDNISPMLSRILQQDIHFKITIGPNACHSILDSSQVEQAIMNLVVNAQEATSGSRRYIELRTYSKTFEQEQKLTTGIAEKGKYHVLEVIDNGHGMPAEVIERIFEPFFTTKEGAGTGLGLAIAYSIINKCNGFANIDSAIGDGTRFSLYFPHSDEVLHEDESVENAKTPDTQFSESEVAQTILVAEDQESLREILQISLGKAGHNLHVAQDGLEALEIYKKNQHKIDLVLTDSVMPRMSGSELAISVRELNPDSKIIIMSGLPQEELFKDSPPVEINAFISKPFSIKDLLKQVENQLVKEIA